MLNLTEIAKETAEIMVANGWRDKPRNFFEDIALIHSEISEALEDVRAGHEANKVWYTRKKENGTSEVWNNWNGEGQPNPEWKPNGIPSELADVIIRLADTAELRGIIGHMEEEAEYIREEIEMEPCMMDIVQGESMATSLSKLHYFTSLALSHASVKDDYFPDLESAKPGMKEAPYRLAEVWVSVERFAEFHEIDIAQAVHEKNANNRTRGYKHGGKVI